MLDISIEALGKAIGSKKKAFDFIKKHIVVVEKMDGTKLTLIRNNTPFDSRITQRTGSSLTRETSSIPQNLRD